MNETELREFLLTVETRLHAPPSDPGHVSEDHIIFEREVGEFLSMVQFRLDIVRSSAEVLDVSLARHFSVFDYIKPDELRLSAIIAELLDPSGNHGQGAIFLLEFLKMLNRGREHALLEVLQRELEASGVNSRGKVQVTRERTTTYLPRSQRRIDIAVDFGTAGMGIENKPWAGEQEEQIKDYLVEVEKRYSSRGFVAFLSGDGHEPESIDKAEKEALQESGKLIVISYGFELKKWLVACYKECKAEKIRWFLADFREYVTANFAIGGA